MYTFEHTFSVLIFTTDPPTETEYCQNVGQMSVSFIQVKARAKYNWISSSSVL